MKRLTLSDKKTLREALRLMSAINADIAMETENIPGEAIAYSNAKLAVRKAEALLEKLGE